MKKLFSLVLAVSIFAAFPIMAADDFSTLIFNKQITIGMSYGNVEAAWGTPRKIDRSAYSSGTREYWFYGKNAMVVFDNGRVVSFHE